VWPLRSGRQRIVKRLIRQWVMGSVRESESVRLRAALRIRNKSCDCSAAFVFQPQEFPFSCGKTGGVVKPHGRLGPLRLEEIALLPRAAYRRSGLLRPFRVLEAPGRIHLGDSFPLRCFQRLSVPAIATRRCTWRCSRDTSGLSDSVLSY
jgi:hypothetical protein